MRKDFTVDQYKQELENSINVTAREGWEYLLAQGTTESDVFEHVRLSFSGTLEPLLRKYRKTRLAARKVRALGKKLEKTAVELETVITQYPSVLPPQLPVPFNLTQSHGRRLTVALDSSRLPTAMREVAARLSAYHPKASAQASATAHKGRVTSDPAVAAALTLVRLFDTAAAGLPASTDTFTQRTSGAAPQTLGLDPEKPYAWTAALLNVACRLAGCSEMFSADTLRKLEDVRSSLP